jgi:hypothetical protein
LIKAKIREEEEEQIVNQLMASLKTELANSEISKSPISKNVI